LVVGDERSMRERMLVGDLYIADDPALAADKERAEDRRDHGDNTVVGAGGVVTTDLPPHVVALGSPARLVRTLETAYGPDPRLG
jgi:maltose O-acetyltransferase